MTVSLAALVSILVYLVIAGLVFWLLWWALEKIAPPQPFLKVAQVVLIVAAVLVCLNFLMGLQGHPIVRFG